MCTPKATMNVKVFFAWNATSSQPSTPLLTNINYYNPLNTCVFFFPHSPLLPSTPLSSPPLTPAPLHSPLLPSTPSCFHSISSLLPQEIVTRMGRWIDFRNDYKTLYPWFMETIWWVFKQIYDKGLVYRGYKVGPTLPIPC